MNLPTGLAVDTSGVVYIADSDNHRIRRVDLNGIITTFAGIGTQDFPVTVGKRPRPFWPSRKA